MSTPKIIPVILCGGSGTRLWPASREAVPKQFLALTNADSLLQNTVTRALRVSSAAPESIMVVSLGAMKDSLISQLDAIHPKSSGHILCEPSARNTAAAVAFAASYVASVFGEDAILWILPADHHIGDEDALKTSFGHALSAAQDGKLVTFGITPTRPDTGYGYIRSVAGANSNILAVEEFVEKPDLSTAKAYMESGRYLWNSGMFLFSAKTVLDEFAHLSPAILDGVRAATASAPQAPDATAYAAIESQPFDKAIMEKSSKVVVVPSDPAWSDIGSWESLWELRSKDENNNVLEGHAVTFGTKNSLIQSKKKLIAVAGLDNIVVIETDDAILIMNKSDNDSMKQLVKQLKDSGAREVA